MFVIIYVNYFIAIYNDNVQLFKTKYSYNRVINVMYYTIMIFFLFYENKP